MKVNKKITFAIDKNHKCDIIETQKSHLLINGGEKMKISNKKIEIAMAKNCLTIAQAAERAGTAASVFPRFSIRKT